MISAIILAGSDNDGSLKECSDATSEALIKIGDKTMVEYVINALEEAKEIQKIVIVGPKEDLDKLYHNRPHIITVESGNSIINSLLQGINSLKEDFAKQVLVVTADIPLITGQIIDDFLGLCRNKKRDVIYPIVSKEQNEKKFPGVKRTYAKLKEGVFTGGNIFIVNPNIVAQCATFAEKIIALRKSPFKLVEFIGLSYVLKYIFGRLSITDAEKRVSELLGIQVEAVIVPYPEIGVDVDKPSDLDLATKILSI